jgi:YbbR domain-containing protein
MPGFVTRNWKLKLLAIVLATIGWAGVIFATNPPGTRAVSLPVPQPPSPTVSLPAGYVLTQPIPNLTVYITGTEDQLNTFSRSSLQVSVDYSAVRSVGSRVPATVKVPVTVTNSDPNIDLDNPPTSVAVDVDTSGTANQSVLVKVSHTPPPGYEVATTAVTPAAVTVTGPEHELQGIQIETTQIDLSNQLANFNGTVALYPYDRDGRLLTDVNVTPATVDVAITVVGLDTSRTSSVLIGPVTGVAPGYEVTVDSYSPATVILTGSQAVINDPDLASVSTGGVDVAGQTGTVTYRLTLQVPAGISVSPSASVTVTITVTQIPTPTPSPSAAPTPTPTA